MTMVIIGRSPGDTPRELAWVPATGPLGIIDSLVSAAFGGISGIQVEFPAPCRNPAPNSCPNFMIPYSPDIPAGDKVEHSPAILPVNQ